MTWYYAYDQDLWPAIFSIALTIFLGFSSWHRRKVPGAMAFAIGCLFAMLWAIGASLEIAAVGFSTKVFWIRFTALWQIPTVTALSFFFLEYAGYGRFLTRRNLILLSIPALVIFGLMVTDEAHHLIWTSFSQGDPVMIQYGIGTWVSILYANLLGIVNILALLRLAIRTPRSRRPVAIMLFGLISGRLFYVLDRLDNRFFSPGESVFVVIGLSCSAYAFALFYFRVLDPIPLARKVVIEQITDGMLVLDLSGHIVEINAAASKIFDLPASRLCGRALTDVLPADSGIDIMPGRLEISKPEVILGKADASRLYNPSLTNLTDKRGDTIGYLMLLHDITAQRRSQDLLMEHQWVVATLQERDRLARELHDSIGQVLGYISMQAQAAQQWALAGHAEKASPLLNRLAEVAQEAHADVRESILSLRTGTLSEWTFHEALRKYLDHYRAAYGIDTEVLMPDEPAPVDFKPETGVQVLRVIQEAMVNASKHGNAQRVAVTFEKEADRIQVRITDDGRGFDPDAVHRESGKHFGLTFMHERMAQIGGQVKIDSKPGSGTTVFLDVPMSK